MPDPASYSSEDEWMEACVPAVMDEGKPRDAAVAQCISMWRDRDKSAAPSADRAWSTLTIKSVNTEQREIEGIASTPRVDRIGDIVEPLGAKFTLPMPLLHHHKHDAPVGNVTEARATKDGISIKAKFAKIVEPGPLKERIETAWQEVKAGLIRGLSIGFKPLEYEFLEGKSGGLRFTSWAWYELSLVTVAANADASIQLVKSLDNADLKAAPGREERGVAGWPASAGKRPGASGKKSSVTLKMPETSMSKTIGEQLAALEAKRAAHEARMNEIMSKAMDEGRSTDEAERETYDELEQEVETIDGDLKRFRSLEKINQAKAKPVEQVKSAEDASTVRGGGYIRVKAPELPPGVAFARLVKCIGAARGNLVAAVHVAERMYPEDVPIHNVLKAAVAAGSTTNQPWAGALVSAEGAVFAEFLEFLRPRTILGQFGAGGVPGLRRIPFRVPIGSQTSGGVAQWVGEGVAKPLTYFEVARTSLEPLKVAAIVVTTEELLRYASMPAEEWLRDQLVEALRERLDLDFIDPAVTAIPGIRPASITNGATTVTSTGSSADAVRADVAAAFGGFIGANNRGAQGVWIMDENTALRVSMMTNTLGQTEDFARNLSTTGGTFAGLPVVVSEYVGEFAGSPGASNVWLVAANQIFLGEENGCDGTRRNLGLFISVIALKCRFEASSMARFGHAVHSANANLKPAPINASGDCGSLERARFGQRLDTPRWHDLGNGHLH